MTRRLAYTTTLAEESIDAARAEAERITCLLRMIDPTRMTKPTAEAVDTLADDLMEVSLHLQGLFESTMGATRLAQVLG